MAELPPRAVWRFDRFTLDPGSGVLLAADGAELPLRPKSFAMLQLLVESGGQLVSRDAIMTAIWPDVFVTDDSITQCIGEIRRALGHEAHRLLQTHPRRGYRLTCTVARADRLDTVAFDLPQGREAAKNATDPPQPTPDVSVVAVLPFADMSPGRTKAISAKVWRRN